MKHHPSLRELAVEGLCSWSLVKGAVEGMANRHGVEKLVVTSNAMYLVDLYDGESL